MAYLGENIKLNILTILIKHQRLILIKQLKVLFRT